VTLRFRNLRETCGWLKDRVSHAGPAGRVKTNKQTKVAQCCEESPKKDKKNSRLLGTWYLEDFQKKLVTKLFIFTVKFFFTLFFFYLVLALESISGVKSRLLCQTPLNINFSQKLSNYNISLWRKVFFSFLTIFFPFILKLLPVARPGVTKKNKKTVAYWEHGIWGFSKKN
jgi:F0F1-type ATP synthase membrane subunit a